MPKCNDAFTALGHSGPVCNSRVAVGPIAVRRSA